MALHAPRPSLATILIALAPPYLLAQACGSDVDPGTPDGGASRVVKTIGPDGGSFELDDGARLEIAAGSLETDVELTFERVAIQTPEEAGLISSTYRLSPDHVPFARPIDVSLPVTGDTTGVHLLVGQQGGGSWDSYDASITEDVATGSSETAGGMGMFTTSQRLVLPCESYVTEGECPAGEVHVDGACAATMKPAGQDSTWPTGCGAGAGTVTQCPGDEVDVACNADHTGVVCFCGDAEDSSPPGYLEDTRGPCGSGDPCGVRCTTFQIGAGCVLDEPVTGSLSSLVPSEIIGTGGTAPLDDKITVTLDIATCRIELVVADACAASGHFDVAAGTCEWEQSFVVGDVCEQKCAVDCELSDS
jgi:hypothetical protein